MEMMVNPIAKSCYILIENDRYEYEDMKNKLDKFYLYGRINSQEFEILMGMLEDKKETVIA